MFIKVPRLGPTRVVLVAAGVLTIALLIHHGRALDGAEAAASKTRAAIPVTSVRAALADMPVFFEGIGTVQAYYTATITARVDGQLQAVSFIEGQQVKKGAVLAQIDPRPYQAALQQATAGRSKDEAQLQNAESDLARYRLLAPRELASKQTLDAERALVAQLQAQIESDQGAIDNARTQLAYTRITAPIDGRTGIRRIDPGNNVHANDTSGIVVVTQVQPIAVIFTLPEDELADVADAMAAGPVEVAAVSRDGKSDLDRGTLSLIDNQIDPSTGTVRLKAVFPNKNNRLWPGEFVNARIRVRTLHDALVIPAAALQRGPNGEFVYVIGRDFKVEARPVTVSAQTNSVVAVGKGLKVGERLVTTNQYRLQPGAEVNETRNSSPPGGNGRTP